jgi:hypothetical protein
MRAIAGMRQKGSAMRIRNRILASRPLLLLMTLAGVAAFIAAAPASSLHHVSGDSQVVAVGDGPDKSPVGIGKKQGTTYLLAPDPPPIGPKPS